MNATVIASGFYGKLPHVGDFVSRRLPGAFVRRWDDWLQEALTCSQSVLGEKWLDIYLTSPIWRFALSAGVCGDRAYAGILMPSVDKVGRYFPLTLAAPLEEQTMIPGLFLEGAQWFDTMEALALSVLEDNFNFEDFDRKLRNLPAPHTPFLGSLRFEYDGVDEKNQRLFRVQIDEPTQIRDPFIDLGALLPGGLPKAFSLWCASGSERVKPSLSGYRGLPPPSAYAELLAGEGGQIDTRNVTASQPQTQPHPNPGFCPDSLCSHEE
ncbi:MAG: type VI secretion system-associated protein TagF [Syntrophobacteraceae bacterium]|nr:type VI secretion system-associated protein TagF [Syntrophobacteraceae bacterium]